MKKVASVTLRICGTAVVSALVACAVPEFEIEPGPVGASVYVDGRRVFTRSTAPAEPTEPASTAATTAPARSLKTPLRYYGTVAITGSMPTNDWLDVRREVTIDEPFSPWLLPFDFVLECVTYPFRSEARYAHRVVITVPERTEATPGIAPRDIPALKARARAALGER